MRESKSEYSALSIEYPDVFLPLNENEIYQSYFDIIKTQYLETIKSGSLRNVHGETFENKILYLACINILNNYDYSLIRDVRIYSGKY